MASSSGKSDIENYIRWALSVKQPMIIEYANRKEYVLVKIRLNFTTTVVCKECDEDGPHITPDHIFRIILTTTRDGSREMRIFNDNNNNCVVPSNTEAFKLLQKRLFVNGNQSYFYGRVDEDDRTRLYVNIKKLPTQ